MFLTIAKDRDHLQKLIRLNIERFGNECNLNYIDTSSVTNMSYMFYMLTHSKFNGDISQWDVSKVINMFFMFNKSPLVNNKPSWYK
jgi:surface protein